MALALLSAGCAPEVDPGPPPEFLTLEEEPIAAAAIAADVSTSWASRREPPWTAVEERTRIDARRVFHVKASHLATKLILEPLRAELEDLTGRDLVFELDSDRGAARAVAAGQYAAAILAGPLTRRDRERGLQEVCLGYHLLATVVNHDNPVTGMSRQSLKDLLTGAESNWIAVGAADRRIEIIALPASDPLETCTASLTLAADPLSASALRVRDRAALAARVAETPAAIGLLPLASVKPSQLRVLTIDGVFPSAEAAQAGTYPYAVPIVLATRGEPDAETAAVLRALMSAAGEVLRRRVLTL